MGGGMILAYSCPSLILTREIESLTLRVQTQLFHVYK